MFVDEMFEFLVNKLVVIKDVVGIGRSKKEGASEDVQRPRPLLVKLNSVWDCRLLLASKSKRSELTGYFCVKTYPLMCVTDASHHVLILAHLLFPLPLPTLSLFLVIVIVALLIMTLPGI